MFQSLVFVNVSVVVLCASPDSVREIMIKAHELNFDNGEYVFFNIDLFSRLELCLFSLNWVRHSHFSVTLQMPIFVSELIITV